MNSIGGFLRFFSVMASQRIISIDYEVFGKVQGVFFRKYTQQEATKLKLVGWVQNTNRDTVVGTIQGPEDNIQKMKHWLCNVGSKKSRIDKCDFRNEKTITAYDYKTFDIDRAGGKSSKYKATTSKSKVKC